MGGVEGGENDQGCAGHRRPWQKADDPNVSACCAITLPLALSQLDLLTAILSSPCASVLASILHRRIARPSSTLCPSVFFCRCRDRSICPPLHPIPQAAAGGSIASGSGSIAGGPSSSILQKSRSSTPLGFSSSSGIGMDLSGFGTVTASGTTVSRAGVVFLDCLICGRPVSSLVL